MKLLIDMNLSPAWCEVLRLAGYEAIHWSDVGSANARDEEVMTWARRHGHTVLTHDLDFSAILAHSGSDGPSVVQVRAQDVSPAGFDRSLLQVLRDHRNALTQGAIVVVDEARARVRILPLADR